MDAEFKPRWGGSIFDCNFCGQEGMQWTEFAPDKWAPFDLLSNSVHNCISQHAQALTQDDVIQRLQQLGFEPHIPRTVSWKYALIASNASQTIYFLVGRRSIDLKFYDHLRKTEVDETGKLYTDGGLMVRNNYSGSDANVHEIILELASRLVTNTPIDEFLLSGTGRTWREQKSEYIRNQPKSTVVAAKDELVEIYEAISPGDGEDAYLGDGVWISPDGSLDDRGR